MSILLSLALAAQTKSAQICDVQPVTSGMSSIIGGYIPTPIPLSAKKPANVVKVPAGIAHPLYGAITMEGKSYTFLLDQKSSKECKLYIDANGDGDLTNDSPTKWGARKQGAYTLFIGTGILKAKIGKEYVPLSIGVYRFDPSDPQRAQLKNTLLAYADYGVKGQVTFGTSSFPFYVADSGLNGFDATKKGLQSALVGIDRTGDGHIQGQAEQFRGDQPINIGGTTLQLSAIDLASGEATFAPSSQQVAEIPLPPDLSVGKAALAFTATTTDGKTVHFPEDYKGKIVLLDFWATWCGPCKGEIPYSTAAYEKYHGKGYDVLGVSLDQPNQADMLKKFTEDNKMPWPQIYEGKFWDVSLVKQYGVEGIPFVVLVDGTTGKVLATEDDLRGDALAKTIQKFLPSAQAN